jgi:serine/threonine protein kinase
MIKTGAELIPGFRLEELLGRGQFGEVWRARSPGSAYVAMKFLQLSGTHGWKEYRAIQRVKQIRHANLMPIIAIWLLDEDGKLIEDDALDTIASGVGDTGVGDAAKATIVAEPAIKSRRPAQMVIETPLGDQTLRDRLRDCQAQALHGIPKVELLKYLEEAAKGLAFLNSAIHKIGDSQGAVQHCDVKPDNIMLMGGSAVVTDFGVAQATAAVDSDATATSLGGTPAYMAPECFKSKTSHSTDQYALAITYYELSTGELPFVERTYAAVYEAHKKGKLDFSAVTQREQAVLRRATSVDPDRRFESCTELIERLREAVAPPSGARPRKKWGVPAAIAGGLATAAVIWTASILFPNDEPPPALGKALAAGAYDRAAWEVERLEKPADINAGLAALQQALGGDADDSADGPLRDDAALKANLHLVGFLTRPERSAEVDPTIVAAYRVCIVRELDRRLDHLRAGCAQVTTTEPAPELRFFVKAALDVLQPTAIGAAAELDDIVARRDRFLLQELRLDARAKTVPDAELRQRLQAIQPQRLEGDDAAYHSALQFIFSGNGGELTPQNALEQLSAYLRFREQIADRQRAPWEQQRILERLGEIDAKFKRSWLFDDNLTALRDAVASIRESLKIADAARNPIQLAFQMAQEARRDGNFPEARNKLELAVRLAESGAPDKPDANYQRFEDEAITIDLLDPATPTSVIQQRLATSASRFDAWARIADAIHRDYGLGDFRAVDAGSIVRERAALIEYLLWECRLSGVNVGGELPSGDELKEIRHLLEISPFADYAKYVEALDLRKSAADAADPAQRSGKWGKASGNMCQALAAPHADSLLQASFRRRLARDVLVEAVAAWTEAAPPKDEFFGSAQFFGEHATDVLSNLLAAQALTAELSPDQALGAPSQALLVAAAAADWDHAESAAASLIPITDALLAEHADEKTVSDLRGLILLVRSKSQLASNIADGPALASAAEGLAHIYLNRRHDDAGNDVPLASEFVAALWREFVDNRILAAAERASGGHDSVAEDGVVAADLATVFRAAGYLAREDAIASNLRQQSRSPEDLAYDCLQRANERAPDVRALIEQGLVLPLASQRGEDWRERLNAVADQGLELARQQSATVLQARAYALKAYARLERARRQSRSPADRSADRKAAQEAIAQALEAFGVPLGERPPAAKQLPPAAAESLITLASINVEFAFYNSLDDAARRDYLRAAATAAEQAASIGEQPHPDFAFNAWGNALEDLAYYVYDEPTKNYDVACGKFSQARDVPLLPPTGVALQYAAHLPAHKNLLRARLRWALSGALPDEAADRELLTSAIHEAESAFASLDPAASDPKKLGAKKAVDAAELLYWLSEGKRVLAASPSAPEAERRTYERDAETALRWAIAWADLAQDRDAWADYTVVLGRVRFRAGGAADAEAAARAVLNAESTNGVRPLPANLCNATELFLDCAEANQRTLTDAEWEALAKPFPATDSAAAPYLVKVRIRQMNKQNSWNDAKARFLDALVDELKARDPTSPVVAELVGQWKFQQAFWHGRAANDATDATAKRAAWLAAANGAADALAALDGRLPQALWGRRDRLKSDASLWTSPVGMARWERTKLREHFQTTHNARVLFLESLFAWTISGGEDARLRDLGRSELAMTRPEITSSFLPAEAQGEWSLRHPQLRKVILP